MSVSSRATAASSGGRASISACRFRAAVVKEGSRRMRMMALRSSSAGGTGPGTSIPQPQLDDRVRAWLLVAPLLCQRSAAMALPNSTGSRTMRSGRQAGPRASRSRANGGPTGQRRSRPAGARPSVRRPGVPVQATAGAGYGPDRSPRHRAGSRNRAGAPAARATGRSPPRRCDPTPAPRGRPAPANGSGCGPADRRTVDAWRVTAPSRDARVVVD